MSLPPRIARQTRMSDEKRRDKKIQNLEKRVEKLEDKIQGEEE